MANSILSRAHSMCQSPVYTIKKRTRTMRIETKNSFVEEDLAIASGVF